MCGRDLPCGSIYFGRTICDAFGNDGKAYEMLCLGTRGWDARQGVYRGIWSREFAKCEDAFKDACAQIAGPPKVDGKRIEQELTRDEEQTAHPKHQNRN